MPNIPTYRSNRPKSTNIGQAPLNPSVANVAGQAVGQGFAAGARAEMRGLQQLGGSVADFGSKVWQVEQRKNDLIDNNSTIQARQMRELDRMEQQLWEKENPHETWVPHSIETSKATEAKILQLQGSDQWRQRETLNGQFNVEASSVSADTRATIQLGRESVELAKNDYVSSVSKYGIDSDQAKASYATASDTFTKYGMSEGEQKLVFGEMNSTAIKVYEKFQKDNNEELISIAVRGGILNTKDGAKKLQSMVDSLTKDATERTELLRFAKTEQSTLKEQEKIDTDNLHNDVLTQLFEHRNDDPVARLALGNKLADQLKGSGMEPSKYSALLNAIDDFQTKPNTLNHDPVLSGKLQSEAEESDTIESQNDILSRSLDAYNNGKIKGDELELISKSSAKSYRTVIGQQKKTMVDDFRYIATKGYSTSDIEGWMKAQVLSARAAGTKPNYKELTNKWTRAAQARQWIVNEYNSMLDGQIDRIEKEKGRELTSKEIRTVGLTIQRFWLRKSDSQLVDLYDQWLKK